MIYLRLRESTTTEPGHTPRLGEVADVLADASLKLHTLPINAPRTVGVWKLDALSLIREIQARHPKESVVLLGRAQGTLICKRERKPRWAGLRAVLAFVLLFAGSAMAIAWFHADVNMPEAQRSVAQILTGNGSANPWWIALPYALGVGSGVAFYYALIGRKTASPLDIKLSEYRRQAQLQMARDSVAYVRRGESEPRG
ncbi:MAG: hypothetical protein FWD25_10150 [Clostridia bacterium]|nr:hypothetical protein [Clostridia bacterium]